MSNRNITINDLDRPDFVPAPETNPIGYSTGTHGSNSSQRPRRRVPFTGVLAGAVVAGVASVAAWQFGKYLYASNPMLQAVVDNGVVAVALAFFVFLMFAMIAGALWLQGWATQRGVTVLPGGMPVHNLDLLAGWQRPNVAALAANTMREHYDVQRTLAANSQYRNVTSYSPSTSTSTSHRQDTPALLDDGGGDDTPELPTGPVPPFDDLFAAGTVGRGTPLLLGIDTATGDEVRGSWLDLYSTAVAGLSGGGKTTTQRFLAAQAAMHGARFVIGDPHYGAADDSLGATLEPLRSAFLCDVADTDKRIMDAVRLVAHIGEQRISGKDRDATPVILWIDEATKLLGHSQIGPELAALLEQIAQQYRKRGVYASIAGQIWTADRTGGSSAMRDSLASVLCHRMKRSQARLLLPTEEARMVERLPKGHAVLWRTSGETVTLAIPNTTAASLRAVGERLNSGADHGADHGASAGRAMGFQRPDPRPVSAAFQPAISPALAAGATASGRGQTGEQFTSAEAARIVALFRDGMEPSAIVAEVFGLKSNAGQPYITKLRQVNAAIRAALAK